MPQLNTIWQAADAQHRGNNNLFAGVSSGAVISGVPMRSLVHLPVRKCTGAQIHFRKQVPDSTSGRERILWDICGLAIATVNFNICRVVHGIASSAASVTPFWRKSGSAIQPATTILFRTLCRFGKHDR
jgi:hypothetical protein